MTTMTFEEFVSDIKTKAEKDLKSWNLRLGQSIFNTVDEEYGVARIVQFEDGIDCFYNDDKIEDFLKASYTRYSQIKNNLL